MSAHKIIEGIKQAIAGNIDRVTIDGQVWVKRDAEIERARAALRGACDWLEANRPKWGPGTLPTWYIDAKAIINEQKAGNDGV